MKLLTVLSFLTLLLTGCGGGGGGGDDGPGPTFPVDAVVSTLYTSAHNFTVNYTDRSTQDKYTITYNITPSGDAVFEGVAAKTAIFTGTGSVNGTVVTTFSVTEYFQINPYRYLGAVDSNGEYEVAADQTALPSTASIGDSGNFFTATTFSNSSKTSTTEVTDVDWALQRDSSSTTNAYFCANTKYIYTLGPSDESAATCFKINEAGTISGARFSYKYSDETTVTYE